MAFVFSFLHGFSFSLSDEGESLWILLTGFWNDLGLWEDTATWTD